MILSYFLMKLSQMYFIKGLLTYLILRLYLYDKKGMCQNTQNMKITPVTDICSKGNFVKKRVLTPSFYSQI